MMKKIFAGVLVGMNLFAPMAFAAETVTFSGDATLKVEKDTAEGSANSSAAMYSLKLKAEAELGAGWSLYGRIGAQYATNPSFGDYNLDVYGDDNKSAVALDQFGLNYKTEQMVYKLGRQDVAVGKTALLYSRPDSNIGKRNFVDGLSADGTIGNIELTGLIAKEDNQGSLDNKLYALRTGFTPGERLNCGITMGRYQDDTNGTTNHWAVDGTYKLGKNSFTTEFTKSNSSSDNQAYTARWNYGFSDKIATYITGFRVETNGDMGKQSDYDNDNRGIHYGVTYQLSNANGLEVVYKDQKVISNGENNTKLEVTLSHAF
ncbi:MAG: hypothetical protein H6Q73_1866 [Firmicutes bacterium]|nr:hypothetical protein [Bacillota bacterium]